MLGWKIYQHKFRNKLKLSLIKINLLSLKVTCELWFIHCYTMIYMHVIGKWGTGHENIWPCKLCIRFKFVELLTFKFTRFTNIITMDYSILPTKCCQSRAKLTNKNYESCGSPFSMATLPFQYYKIICKHFIRVYIYIIFI